MNTIGIDGCKAGWFCIILNGNSFSVNLYSSLSDLIAENTDDIKIIDIPIGLKDYDKSSPSNNDNLKHARACDKEARKYLGPGRGSSIFPSPNRCILKSLTIDDAKEIYLEKIGHKITNQTWCILDKIKEADNSNARSKKIFESHPEVCFKKLNGEVSLDHSKKTKNGRIERLAILKNYNKHVEEIYEISKGKYLRKDVEKDDIIDAICLAIVGQYVLNSSFGQFPKKAEIDNLGIEMKIVFPII